jgi:hypothetical protein
MHQSDEEADKAAGRADELDWVCWTLARMIESWLAAPLSRAEQNGFRELVRREHELLEKRLLIVEDTGGTETTIEPSTPQTAG